MTETGSSIEVTKAEIEKARKEAKQQKGLLAIAKKQLAAREAERAKVTQELQEATAEAEEATREREVAEAELARETTVANTANGHPFAPSPSLSADSATSPAQLLPDTPGSPSSVNGSTTAKSNNPFERLTTGPGSPPQLQSPFLAFANAPVPTPPAATSTQNEGTTTDNPFTFDQVFGGEESKPGPDVQELSTVPEGNGQPFTGKVESEPKAGANDEVSDPSSDLDLFMTPPTSALDSIGASPNALTAEPAVQNRSPLRTPSATLSTDRPSDTHIDINTPLKDLDVNESDSSDNDSEDETPLATLVGRPPPGLNGDGAVKEAPISNGDASPQTTAETTFPPLTEAVAAAEVQGTNPFPTPAKDTSPFSTSIFPFAASSVETPKAATVSEFDKVFGDLPDTTPAAAGNNLSFGDAFDDQFNFTEADAASPTTEGLSSASSSAFPPPPTSASGAVKPLTTISRDSGFENAFSPQQGTAGTARQVDGLPVLPPVPESKPFSFDTSFATNLSAAPPPGATTQAAPSQPPFNAPTASPSSDDAFGLDSTQQGSAFGTTSSRSSSIPQVMQSPVSALVSSSPVQGTTSPREVVNFPASPGPPPASPPPRIASPKGRPSSSSKDSGKEPARHSKLSVSDIVHYCPGVEKMTLVPILDPSAI
jgi:epidermal growth factor receptor substrate 15